MANEDQIVIYQTKGGKVKLDVQLQDETVWLNQAQLVKLFGRDQSVISRHINNVFKESELNKKSNMHFLHIANSDKPVASATARILSCGMMYNIKIVFLILYKRTYIYSC